jgi:hypothetical protein
LAGDQLVVQEVEGSTADPEDARGKEGELAPSTQGQEDDADGESLEPQLRTVRAVHVVASHGTDSTGDGGDNDHDVETPSREPIPRSAHRIKVRQLLGAGVLRK